jgi:hypothetical protein
VWTTRFSLSIIVSLALRIGEAIGAVGTQQKPAEARSGAERRGRGPEQDCGGWVGAEVIAAGGHRPEAGHVIAVRSRGGRGAVLLYLALAPK